VRLRDSVDGKVVDPVGEELGDFLSLPGGSHMACSVHCGEIHAVVADEVARDLPVSDPLAPRLLYWEVEAFYPLTRAKGWNSTVGVT